MYKTKTIIFILLFLTLLVFGGCTRIADRGHGTSLSSHDDQKGISQVPWYEPGAIDIDWPY